MKVLTQEECNQEDVDVNEACPSMTTYLLSDAPNAPMIIVIPGGAYHHRAYHEGEPVAKWLNQAGYHACVLRYHVAPFHYPIQLQDGQYAIRYVRYHLPNWGISSQSKVGVLGFSAGGHLAAMLSTMFDDGIESPEDPIERQSSRPDFQILCYPVITMGEYTHEGSKQNLLGETQDASIIKQLSCENLVSDHTPPAFIWSTAEDQAVSSMNSLLYVQALQKRSIPYDLHIYQEGRHGLGLANDQHHTRTWKDACLDWMEHYIK
ncbi:Esterase/lipase-like protein [Gracilibacillus halophilus YIM-C55.5]|uniref:Esterase/lipase-like protein n=1 Tax=Gracilibacillus halophilus YIM-C55.5 TaxID=1308866 RepID=N4WM72_9BACI|nr:alpha/beta hydrolase [Gracilibacillus halophilus]ENH97272.1 Esterase/lipase-like protein [Gracilibacillus halophilus YIM-C55.5]